MILKGSQRGSPNQLAVHLLNLADNDHVTVHELRGFVSEDLFGAMTETMAIARGTSCRQPIFSLSVNPPKNSNASLADITQAIERIESTLGLEGQPRAIVVHEKEGRRHAHAVWSRIDAEEMKAINLPFFKNRLRELSKELYLQHGWPLPEGHRTNGWKNPLNFTLAEWQQAKRQGLDPREIKQVFREAWDRSDSMSAFGSALEQAGFYLAKGDRRGIVATDMRGEVYSVARWTGLKTKELLARFSHASRLPELNTVRMNLEKRGSKRLREFIVEDRKNKERELAPLKAELSELVTNQRSEREQLKQFQDVRRQKETAERTKRFRRGIGIVFDLLSGQLFRQRKRNESEAYACFVRDRFQRERLVEDQAKERVPIETLLQRLKHKHAEERRIMSARMAKAINYLRHRGRQNEQTRDFDFGL